MKTKVQCPVCKRTDHKIQLWEVFTGHKKPCIYVCCECQIVFKEGSTSYTDLYYNENYWKPADKHQDFIN